MMPCANFCWLYLTLFAGTLAMLLGLISWKPTGVFTGPLPEPPPTQFSHGMDAYGKTGALKVVDNLLESLDKTKSQSRTLHDGLVLQVHWEGQSAEDVEKIAAMFVSLEDLLEDARMEAKYWQEEWGHTSEWIKEGVTKLEERVGELALPDEAWRIVGWLRLKGWYKLPNDNALEHALCNFANENVYHISTLSARADALLPKLELLYQTTDHIHAAVSTLASHTWADSLSFGIQDCDGKTRSIEACGTDSQKVAMRRTQDGSSEHRAAVERGYWAVYNIVKLLERQCKHVQTFQLSRRCPMPHSCTDTTRLKPHQFTQLPPEELARYLVNYAMALMGPV